MLGLFGVKGELDFRELKRLIGAGKVFYYDCLDDKPRENENQDDFERRIRESEDFFNSVQSLDGYHVIYGTLAGKPEKLRQKEVDVQLAVDMLTHAFHKNMTRAGLISGDLDFRPVVKSLVYLGTYVTVHHEKHSEARDLYRAADWGREINLYTWHSWSARSLCLNRPFGADSSASGVGTEPGTAGSDCLRIARWIADHGSFPRP